MPTEQPTSNPEPTPEEIAAARALLASIPAGETSSSSVIETKTKPRHHEPPKKRNPRRGKVSGKEDEPAQFQPGDAAPPEFDPAPIAEKLDIWWVDGAGDKYLIFDREDGEYATWSERKVTKELRMMPGQMIATKQRDGERIAESERVFLHVMKRRKVAMEAPAVAGHFAGVHTLPGGRRMIVKTSPRIIQPKAPPRPEPKGGSFPIIKSVVDGRLGEQSRYFYSWLKISYETLTQGSPGNFRPGQALVFAGRAGSAKSFLQHQLITPILGGRSADPESYMFGRTDFNAEIVAAEHLLMEDPASTTLTKDRVFFGEQLKRTVVNQKARFHRKSQDGETGQPFWRLTISINDDPDKMRVLPLYTPDIIDKMMIFHVESAPLPMPTETLEERKALRDAITEELPHFIAWLVHTWEIPEDIHSTRYGVSHYHDANLVTSMVEDTPSSELLALIDAAIFKAEGDMPKTFWELANHNTGATADKLWQGTAIDLEKLLMGEYDGHESSVRREAEKLFHHNKCLRLLQRLKEDAPDRVDNWRNKSTRGWAIAVKTTSSDQ